MFWVRFVVQEGPEIVWDFESFRQGRASKTHSLWLRRTAKAPCFDIWALWASGFHMFSQLFYFVPNIQWQSQIYNNNINIQLYIIYIILIIVICSWYTAIWIWCYLKPVDMMLAWQARWTHFEQIASLGGTSNATLTHWSPAVVQHWHELNAA